MLITKGRYKHSWCGRRELNPYGKTTRPSNVRVCQFRHSRNGIYYYTQTILICQGLFSFFSKLFSHFFTFIKLFDIIFEKHLDNPPKVLYNISVCRGIAQLVEYWSPKPWVVGSSPSAPAKNRQVSTEACRFYFFTLHSSLFTKISLSIFGK